MYANTATSSWKGGNIAAMTGLFAAGLAAMAAGGPLWGFLGTAAMLFCVWWVYHRFQYHQFTREIERFYNPEPVASSVGVSPRALSSRHRSFALTPIGKLESAS